MKRLISTAILVLLVSGCSDSPGAPAGTLPVVQNCRIVTGACRGDTVTVAWDPVSVEVDGYRVWYSTTNPGNWQIIAQVEATTAVHIASSTGYYCVDAIDGINSSEDQSNKADDRAEMFALDDTLHASGNNGIRFLPTHVAFGDASDPSFRQDLYVRWEGDTALFCRGNYDPEGYPGGTYSHVALASNTLAPGPGDSAWQSTIAAQSGASYFVSLEGGDYAMLSVDSVSSDMVLLGFSQYQTISGLRLFNPFLF